MNNINRQKQWFIILYSMLFFVLINTIAIPSIKNTDPPISYTDSFSICGLIVTIILFFYNQTVNNFNNFHTQFIKLLDLHRNNVDSINLSTVKKDYPILNNHYFFQFVIDEFDDIKKLVTSKVHENRIMDIIKHEAYDREIKAAQSSNLYIEEITIINISYLVVFFGIQHGKASLKSALNKTYKEEFISGLFESIENNKNETINQATLLHGFQGVLGHYYRHIFGIVKFVDEAKFVTTLDKESMIKMLRSQLSTFEQSLLIINSLSVLGRIWEIEAEKTDKKFITKYNLVRNIPTEFFEGLDPKQIYPEVDYE